MSNNLENKYVEVNGIKTHYIESGQGDPLILIHGGGATSCAQVNYGDVIPYLSKHFRVIAPDVVGFGFTPGRGPQDYSAKSHGDHLVGLIETLDLNNFHIGGNSHGGWLCQYVAHERPNLINCLIIINSLNGTYGIPPEPEGLKYVYGPQGHSHPIPSLETVKSSLSKLYYNQELVTDSRIKMVYDVAQRNHEFARERVKALHMTVDSTNEDLSYKGKHISEYAHEFKMPVILPWGRDDTSMRPEGGYYCEYGWKFYSKLQDAEMHVFPRAKHHVMADQSKRWSEVVTSFLKSNSNSL